MSNAQVQTLAYPGFYGLCPKEGPKAMPTVMDHSTAGSISIDTFLEQAIGRLQFIQTLFIDNSQNPNPYKITLDTTSQFFQVPANSQAYLPIMAGMPMRLTGVTTAGVKVPLIFYNVPMGPIVWKVT